MATSHRTPSFQNVLAACALTLGLAALAALPAEAALVTKEQARRLHASQVRTPIKFAIVKGKDDACGPGCGEWISAEGMLDYGSGKRFRAFLVAHNWPRLPIFFHSPGGSLSDGFEIAHLMREK